MATTTTIDRSSTIAIIVLVYTWISGREMDHMNDGGFAQIRNAFVAEHGLSTIHKSLYRTDLNAMDTLPKTLYDAFVQLHAQMTDDYSLCELITKEEHERRTRERMCED